LVRSTLGNTGFELSPIGYGAFKIGRNENIKYPTGYELPTEGEACRILNGVLDLGVNYIDTAPAYGLSEVRIARCIAARKDEFVLSTKVGETFENGESTYDFSGEGVLRSIRRSQERLGIEVLDIVFVHSDGNDRAILNETEIVPTLRQLKDNGVIKAIGFSGKTIEGARQSLSWADVLMVEYHLEDTSHDQVMHEAMGRGVGVIVKKGLASGRLDPTEAVQFVLSHPAVTSMVIGSLNIDHLRANLDVAQSQA